MAMLAENTSKDASPVYLHINLDTKHPALHQLLQQKETTLQKDGIAMKSGTQKFYLAGCGLSFGVSLCLAHKQGKLFATELFSQHFGMGMKRVHLWLVFHP